MASTEIKTGIGALDRMLFGDEYYRQPSSNEFGFRGGDVVLIRGEPGSGKTTLGLQIASHYLQGKVGKGRKNVQFMTLEEPSAAMQHRCQKYGFARKGFTWVERESVQDFIKNKINQEAGAERKAATVARRIAELGDKAVVEAIKTLPPHFQAAVLGAALVLPPLVEKVLQGLFRRFVKATTLSAKGTRPRLVVIDSLNALMNILLKEFPNESPRLLFNTFCQVLRQDLGAPVKTSGKQRSPSSSSGQPVIIIIGEHHFHELDVEKYLPESFFCDVEIVLRPEPLRLPIGTAAAPNMTLGYELAAVLDPEAKHLESRSFCRVIKARCSPRQSRRCAYDVESGQGLRFFETFPGDGKLMLFAENEQQRSAWTSFFERDLTDAYPALRYETFTMEGLETVYDSSRRLLHVPLRTDMFLSSLDSYWVTGYRDYRLKTHINERLTRRILPDRAWALNPSQSKRTSLSTWTCTQYPAFVNDLVHYALTRFDRDLYQKNHEELSTRPPPAREYRRERHEERLRNLNEKVAKLTHELAALENKLEDDYDELCRYLFGEPLDPLVFSDEEHSDSRAPDAEIIPRKNFGETFLRPLPRSHITLFGQYNADVLPSLVRDDMHQFEQGEDYWLSIPYDANMGVFVARVDLLRQVLGKVESDKTDAHDGQVRSEVAFDAAKFDAAYAKAYQQLKHQEHQVLENADVRAELLLPNSDQTVIETFRQRVRGELQRCEKQLKDGPGPLPGLSRIASTREDRLSWDQVISLSAAAGKPLGLELRSFDTMLAFFLELVWNCGGRIEVNARYEVREQERNALPLILALHYFGAIFKFTRTPRDQTIDPVHFHDGPGGLGDYGDWLFARYWYSTLLDALTAVQAAPGSATESPLSPSRSAAGASANRFAWIPPAGKKPELEIVLMPSGREGENDHYTCWGDWSFGLLQGSENIALACDLVSNLMGDQKVTERGLRGACLPTVSQFYWRYREQPCVPAMVRSDIALPKMTFGQLGEAYLGTPSPPPEATAGIRPVQPRAGVSAAAEHRPAGIFRQSIFDYRHCAREIYGELLWIKRDITQSWRPPVGDAFPDPDTMVGEPMPGAVPDHEIVVGACINIFRGIKELCHRYIFIRESFRHDVAELALQDADRRQAWRKERARLRRIVPPEVNVMFRGQLRFIRNISRGGLCLDARGAAWDGKDTGLSLGSSVYPLREIWRASDKSAAGFQFEKPIGHSEFYRLLRKIDDQASVR